MNRSRRPIGKSFVSGGVLNGEPAIKPQRQINTPQKAPQEQHKKPQPALQPPPPMPILNQQEMHDGQDDSAPIIIEDSNIDMMDGAIHNENGKPEFKKIFAKRKKSSVRAKEKKIRQNRQLRKAIMPKNALMALHEVKGISIGDFMINSNDESGFTALVSVNNAQYEGRGKSKISAKSNACEKALRDIVISKMHKKPRVGPPPKGPAGEPMDLDASQNIDSDGDQSEKMDDDADELPMVNLASFALFKLFSDWESEGFLIPEMHPAAHGSANNNESENDSAPKEPRKTTIRTELPPNWETMHAATLLCMMRPGTTYSDNGTVGEKPNVLQILGVTVDNQEFTGKGRSKKIARRNVAALACNKLFGTNFNISEDV